MLDLGVPIVSILEAINTVLIVVKCLLEFLLGVHDKRPLLRNRLAKGLASNKNELSSFFGLESMHIILFFFRLVQDTAVKDIDKLLAFIMNLSFVDKDNGVPNARNR